MRRTIIGRDRGSATVELAVGLPVLLVFLLTGLTGILAVTAQLRCVDAAREAARVQARDGQGLTAGLRVAPTAAISLTEDAESVHARVVMTLRPLGPHLPAITVRARAVADREPGGPR